MLNLLGKLQRNETAYDVTLSGIELGSIRTRILATNIVRNTSLLSLSMSRKGIEEEVGVDLARMLLVNKNIRKIELEGNKLGPKTAREFGNVLRYNSSLKFLDLDNNSLTSDNEDPTGLLTFIDALKYNKTLQSLNLANNRLDDQIGKAFEDALSVNHTLIDFEFGFN